MYFNVILFSSWSPLWKYSRCIILVILYVKRTQSFKSNLEAQFRGGLRSPFEDYIHLMNHKRAALTLQDGVVRDNSLPSGVCPVVRKDAGGAESSQPTLQNRPLLLKTQTNSPGGDSKGRVGHLKRESVAWQSCMCLGRLSFIMFTLRLGSGL